MYRAMALAIRRNWLGSVLYAVPGTGDRGGYFSLWRRG